MPAGTEAGYEVLWPFMVYSALVLIAVGGILLLSWALGERHRAPGRDLPYESGMNPTGDARVRYGVHFYPVAVFFMLFDMETIFLYAWAVAFPALGWAAYIEAGVFIVVLFIGLVHVWSLGGLDWHAGRQRAAGTGGARER